MIMYSGCSSRHMCENACLPAKALACTGLARRLPALAFPLARLYCSPGWFGKEIGKAEREEGGTEGWKEGRKAGKQWRKQGRKKGGGEEADEFEDEEEDKEGRRRRSRNKNETRM